MSQASEEEPLRRGFTIDHPILTVLLIGWLMAIFEFALMFPPLIYLSRHVSETTFNSIAWEWVPLLGGVLCMVVVARSVLWRILKLK